MKLVFTNVWENKMSHLNFQTEVLWMFFVFYWQEIVNKISVRGNDFINNYQRVNEK